MTTAIKISATAIKTLILLLITNLAFAATDAKSVESITIAGIVKKITPGKDGYMADVQTEKDGMYTAGVSIISMGGPDKIQSCAVGDKVTLKGVPSGSGDAKSLGVTEIISIAPTQTLTTITSTGFRGIQAGDAIAKHGAYAKKTTLKTGEGSFDVYKITYLCE
jgi:hypothetical protein